MNYIESRIVREEYWNYYKKFVPQHEDVTDLAVQYQDLVAAIEMGLTGLPEKSGKVFKLHRMEGWSVPEIANFLNLSEKAIQYHLTQSVKRLRVHLKNYILTVGILIIFV